MTYDTGELKKNQATSFVLHNFNKPFRQEHKYTIEIVFFVSCCGSSWFL
jgi:hypothetical protein